MNEHFQVNHSDEKENQRIVKNDCFSWVQFLI